MDVPAREVGGESRAGGRLSVAALRSQLNVMHWGGLGFLGLGAGAEGGGKSWRPEKGVRGSSTARRIGRMSLGSEGEGRGGDRERRRWVGGRLFGGG